MKKLIHWRRNLNSSFLKWAGGKKWFLTQYSDLIPQEYNTYIEPFLGGGSVFFYLEPKTSILNDLNKELIITYKAVRDNPEKLYNLLMKMKNRHNKRFYYKVRASEPKGNLEIAARMIYLNHTCFNGIYRVNRDGKFNVPIGTDNKIISDDDKFLERSRILKNTSIKCEDFENIIAKAKKGDLLFCDPPYAIRDKDVSISYNKTQFTYNDQIRLATAIEKAQHRNVKIIMTNVNHISIKKLYDKTKFKLIDAERHCMISGLNKGRSLYNELIITANI